MRVLRLRGVHPRYMSEPKPRPISDSEFILSILVILSLCMPKVLSLCLYDNEQVVQGNFTYFYLPDGIDKILHYHDLPN